MPDGYGFYDLINRMDKLYVTYRRRFIMASEGKIFVPKVRGTADQDMYLTKNLFMGHLNTRYAIGVFAGPISSKFVCFDVDLADKALVRRLIDEIERFGFPRDRVYISASGGKGYHVELFFNSTMYTNLLLDFYSTVIDRGGFDWRKVEFRPTAKQSIKLPLSVHPRTGNMCWYLDRETLEPIEDPGYILEIQQIDRDWAADLIRKNAERRGEYLEVNGGKEDKFPRHEYDITHFDGDEYPQMTAPGMMHSLMVSIAVHERHEGKGRDEVKNTLLRWAAEQPKEYVTNSQKEIMDDAERITSWVCGEKFKLSQGSRALNITASEMDLIMAQRGGTRRKVLFLIMLFCKWRCEAHLSMKTMASFTGAAYAGVAKALGDLEAAGVIYVGKSRIRHKKDGGFCSQCKSYTYKIPCSPGEKTMNVEFSFRAEDFMNAWRSTVAFFIPMEEWGKDFSKRELEELQHD